MKTTNVNPFPFKPKILPSCSLSSKPSLDPDSVDVYRRRAHLRSLPDQLQVLRPLFQVLPERYPADGSLGDVVGRVGRVLHDWGLAVVVGAAVLDVEVIRVVESGPTQFHHRRRPAGNKNQ